MSNNQGTDTPLKKQHAVFREKCVKRARQDIEQASWCRCMVPMPRGSMILGHDSCRGCELPIRRPIRSASIRRALTIERAEGGGA